MKTVLHILNTAQTAVNSGHNPFEFISAADAVLLIENAVYSGVSTVENIRLLGNIPATIYVLLPDLKARGFDDQDLLEDINPVDYNGFVDLTAQFDVSVSW